MKRILCLWLPCRAPFAGPDRRAADASSLDAERRARQRLARWCEQFSPTVGWAEAELAASPSPRTAQAPDALPPETLLLDVTGVAPLFGGEEPLVAKIVRPLAERGWQVRAALADTIGAAWAIAHYGVLSAPTAQANATDHQPTTFPAVIVPTGEQATASALAPLPIAALRLWPEHLACLRALGVERIEQLVALSRGCLAERFGPAISQRYDQALGRTAESIRAHRPPPVYVVEQAFEPAVAGLDELNLALAEQLAKLVQPLSERREGVQQLHCQLRSDAQILAQLSVGLFRPSAQADHLLELLRLRLEAVQLNAPITAVRLTVAAAAPLACRQEELFEQPTVRDVDQQLAALVDRLSSRLGWEAVTRAHLCPQAQPEYAWAGEPVLAGAVGRASSRRAIAGGDLPRPLRLARQPLVINVVSLSPDGPPGQFRLGGEEHRVIRHWGPERIETGWWRGRDARRDYYCVETATGRWYWLFRHRTSRRWFLHGWHD